MGSSQNIDKAFCINSHFGAFLLVLLVLLFGPAMPASAASETGALYYFEPDEDYPRRFVDRPFTLGKRMSEARFITDFQQGDAQFNDSGDWIQTPDQRQNIILTLQAKFGFTYFFELAFRVPFIMREIEDIEGPNEGETFEGSGIGDAEIEATYQLQNTGRFFIAGTMGIKLPGSENTNTEGEALTTGSGTLDFFFKAPFKKAWRHWSLGGLVGYRIFGRDEVSDFTFGNRLDIQINSIIQATDYLAFQPEFAFRTVGAKGLSGIASAGENSAEESLLTLGLKILGNPTKKLDLILSYQLPVMGTNTDKFSTILVFEVAFRF